MTLNSNSTLKWAVNLTNSTVWKISKPLIWSVPGGNLPLLVATMLTLNAWEMKCLLMIRMKSILDSSKMEFMKMKPIFPSLLKNLSWFTWKMAWKVNSQVQLLMSLTMKASGSLCSAMEIKVVFSQLIRNWLKAKLKKLNMSSNLKDLMLKKATTSCSLKTIAAEKQR